jgi:hypothetical protein
MNQSYGPCFAFGAKTKERPRNGVIRPTGIRFTNGILGG